MHVFVGAVEFGFVQGVLFATRTPDPSLLIFAAVFLFQDQRGHSHVARCCGGYVRRHLPHAGLGFFGDAVAPDLDDLYVAVLIIGDEVYHDLGHELDIRA